MALTPTTIGIVCALICVHFALREARFERASVRKARISFPPVLSLRATFWIGIPLFLFGAYRVSDDVHTSTDWIYPITCIAFALLVFFSYPGTITVGENAIALKKFPRPAKRLKWENIASAIHSRARAEFVLWGSDGSSIAHTRFHVDPSRFEAELRKRVKTQLIEQ